MAVKRTVSEREMESPHGLSTLVASWSYTASARESLDIFQHCMHTAALIIVFKHSYVFRLLSAPYALESWSAIL